MGLLNRLFGRQDHEPTFLLYNAIVLRAREPHWYLEGRVPDTVGGRFDMVAAVLSLVLLLAVAVPALKKATAALGAGGAVEALTGRVAATGGVVGLIFAAIIFLMVYRPGS